MTQKQSARKFVEYWSFQRGSEKGEDQQFWNSLLGEVLGLEDVKSHVQYQVPVPMKGTTKFLDAWIPETRVLIEHKSRGVNLDAPQAGHNGLTPYEQAVEYDNARAFDEKARWIITCNFDEFRIYDRSKPLAPPLTLKLANLPKEAYRLNFLVNPKEKAVDRELEISVQAGRIVGELYDAFLKQYGNSDAKTLAALNRLCVRLVFCLYAEDAEIFPNGCFRRLVEASDERRLRSDLQRLFITLDTPLEKRDAYLEKEFQVFPYTNGGLFRDAAETDIPPLTEDIRKLLIGATQFDWREITPTIFGALFESTLNPVTRRAGGMVYTSIENIHKVIDPLFLEDLEKRLDDILWDGFSRVERVDRVDGCESDFGRGGAECAKNVLDRINKIDRIGDDENPDNPVNPVKKTLHVSTRSTRLKNTSAPLRLCVNKRQRTALLSLQAEIAALMFLDPASGSGNFLTETFICLRRLENKIIAALQQGQREFDLGTTVKVSISQFHGIEINDFAVSVAKTALWIAEAQMLKETAEILHREPDYLPLKDYDGIIEGNALRMEWPHTNYIMGNPPFVGYSNQSAEQKADMLSIFVDEKGKPYKTAGKLDYVCAWYRKAADYVLTAKNTKVAFVSTNSICQGESVAAFWKPLFEMGAEIDFARRTFRWDNEAQAKAHVHCVIVGFSFNTETQRLKGTEKLLSLRGDSETRRQGEDSEKSPNLLISQSPSSESKNSATLRLCVKKIFDGDKVIEAEHINGYLMDGPDVWVESRTKPICDVPVMVYGNKPTDGGYLFLTKEEKDEVLEREPEISRFIKQIYGATEYINNTKRYCLWLVGASPAEIRKSKFILERIENVRRFRLNSTKAQTRESAETPTLFQEIRQPNSNYIIIPRHSSENRNYIPFGFVSSEIIVNDAVQILPSATLYHFGILTSSVHMAWMRTVCGRLKSDYRYSANIVYNNFPWPEVGESDFNRVDRVERLDVASEENVADPQIGTDLRKLICENLHVSTRSTRLNNSVSSVVKSITQTAQSILDARSLYPDSSLADLYDPLTMPPELRKAHAANDAAVMKAYGYAPTMTEPEIVADLMRRYQELTESC